MGYLEPALLHQSSESNLGVLGRRLVRIGVLRHVLELAIQVRLKETVTVTQSLVSVRLPILSILPGEPLQYPTIVPKKLKDSQLTEVLLGFCLFANRPPLLNPPPPRIPPQTPLPTNARILFTLHEIFLFLS